MFLAHELLRANLQRETCNLYILHLYSKGFEAEEMEFVLQGVPTWTQPNMGNCIFNIPKEAFL